jgi:hypothetical protein
LHFSYPSGYYGHREMRLARLAGYRSARTTDIGWNGPRTNPYQLRILGTVDDCSIDRLAADLTGIGFLLRFTEKRRRSGRALARHWRRALLRRSVSPSPLVTTKDFRHSDAHGHPDGHGPPRTGLPSMDPSTPTGMIQNTGAIHDHSRGREDS